MNPYLTTFLDRAAAFSAMVDTVPAAQWDAPSPCSEWANRDIVNHVIETERDHLARHDLVSDTPPAGGPAEAWAAHLADVKGHLGDGAVLDTPYEGFFGPTTFGETLADFYGFDLVVHRWDLAQGIGKDAAFTEEELDLIEASMKQWGDVAYQPGIFEPPVPVGDEATRQDKLLARMGRSTA